MDSLILKGHVLAGIFLFLLHLSLAHVLPPSLARQQFTPDIILFRYQTILCLSLTFISKFSLSHNDNGFCQTVFLRWHKALGKGLAKGGYGSMDANTAIGTTEPDCFCL